MSERRIHVGYLARAEGEGALDVVIGPDGQVKKAHWNVFEPIRFLEAIGVGRKYDDIPEIAERICAICPHPHHFAVIQAIERAMSIPVSEQTVLLRKLMLTGDLLQSNALHLFFLAAPDFLGYESFLGLAGDSQFRPVVEKALQLKRLANDISVLVGGHEIMFRTSIPGGFTTVPTGLELRQIKERLAGFKDFALETVKLAAELVSQSPYSEMSRQCEHVALHAEGEYALYDGRLISSEGLDIPNQEYPLWFFEKHVPGCNCKHSFIKGRDSFLTGPLARLNLNFPQLSPDAQAAAREVGYPVPNYNPFNSLTARAIEIMHGLDAGMAIIDQLGDPGYEPIKYELKAGESYAVTEAPRGICCHGVRIDKAGVVQMWDIVAPTSRNVPTVEKDITEFVPQWQHLPDDRLTLLCEMMVRNYDPCQSCATHKIPVRIRREG